MKTLTATLVGGITAISQVANARSEYNGTLKDLSALGISPSAVQEAFRRSVKIELNWNEVLKVSENEEGNDLNFTTLDGIAVMVPISLALGPENKVDGMSEK